MNSDFETIHHITHIKNGIEIIRDGRIVSNKINGMDDINVVWLENTNYGGVGCCGGVSYYGGVKFVFSTTIMDGKNFYKIDIPGSPNPTAEKILVTGKEHHFNRYDVCSEDGPFWRNKESGGYFFNKNKKFHILFEDDLSIDELNNFCFVVHDVNRCAKGKCSECESIQDTSARFMAMAIVDGVKLNGVKEFLLGEWGLNCSLAYNAFDYMTKFSTKLDYSACAGIVGGNSKFLIKAICALIVCGDDNIKRSIASMFGDENKFNRAMADAVAEVIGADEGDFVDSLVGCLR